MGRRKASCQRGYRFVRAYSPAGRLLAAALPSAATRIRGQLDDEAVAPAVLGLGEAPDGSGQLGLSPTAHAACQARQSGLADPPVDTRLGQDVPDPVGPLSGLGDEVVAPVEPREPDLDLTRLSRPAPGCREMEVLRFADFRGGDLEPVRARRR
jgi:hypothetical protein